MRILPSGSFWETIGELAAQDYKAGTSGNKAEKMRIVTKKEKIRNIAQTWKEVYCQEEEWIW